MQVVGLTTPQEVYVASKDRKFRINELLVLEDPYQGNLIGKWWRAIHTTGSYPFP